MSEQFTIGNMTYGSVATYLAAQKHAAEKSPTNTAVKKSPSTNSSGNTPLNNGPFYLDSNGNLQIQSPVSNTKETIVDMTKKLSEKNTPEYNQAVKDIVPTGDYSGKEYGTNSSDKIDIFSSEFWTGVDSAASKYLNYGLLFLGGFAVVKLIGIFDK